VFDNGVLRRIFGPKRDEVTVEWRKVHNEEFHKMYLSPNISRDIKSRGMRWAGHVARMGERKPERKRALGRPRSDARMGLEWILGRLAGGCGVDLVGSR
jgi:hypothetical protein